MAAQPRAAAVPFHAYLDESCSGQSAAKPADVLDSDCSVALPADCSEPASAATPVRLDHSTRARHGWYRIALVFR